MRIDGEWYLCDDRLVRPIVHGAVLAADGSWQPALFLVDTGADRTVLSADVLHILGFEPTQAETGLGGVGGLAESVTVETQIRLPLDRGGSAVFRARYAAFVRLESLDMSVLGRDLLDMFAVIVDRPGEIVTLIGQRHRYRIEITGERHAS